MSGPAGYWPSRWPGEDGGPQRLQAPASGAGLGLRPGDTLRSVSRDAVAATMVVLRDPGEAYLLRHTGGDGAISWVERIDPQTLECIERSPDLPGGPTWPGGLAAHADGSIYVVFGNHAHRLAADTSLLASVELPRDRPYNSFVILPDGHIATKDFAGRLAAGSTPPAQQGPSELLVLEPGTLAVVARCELPEPSIARLSALGNDVYVVGDTTLFRVAWDGSSLVLDEGFTPAYRTIDGQTYGWDAVVDGEAAWFLDDGEGSERYAGSFRGITASTAPLHIVRVDLRSAAVTLTEVCGAPGGLIANPPAVDPSRRIVVGYDSSHGAVAAFAYDEAGATRPLWQAELDHASHPVVYPDTGEIVLAHHVPAAGVEQVVVLDVETGAEKGRVDTASPLQSVLFPCAGFGRDLYVCSFTTLSRVWVEPAVGGG